MIKYINEGELYKLKKGFMKTIQLKKLQEISIPEFMNREKSFEVAKRVFRMLLSVDSITIASGFAGIMLEYLLDNKLLDNDDYEAIKDYFVDDSINIENSVDLDDYYNYVDERIEFLDKYLKKLSLSIGIEYESASFYDIYHGYEDIEYLVFGDLRDKLRECSCVEDNEELEDYYGLFQDDATSYALIGHELNSNQLTLLNDALNRHYENGIQSEAYVDNGNTYINISSTNILEGIGYIFFVAITIILSEK